MAQKIAEHMHGDRLRACSSKTMLFTSSSKSSLFEALSSLGRDERTRGVDKNERGIGRVESLLPTTPAFPPICRALRNFPCSRPTENLEQAIGNEGNHPLLFHEKSNQHFYEQHKFIHDMIYAFSLYSVLTKEKFSIQPFALKTAHLFCHFARISVYRTHADIGLSKRSKNNSSEKERFNIAKPGGPRMTGMINLNSTTGTPRAIH